MYFLKSSFNVPFLFVITTIWFAGEWFIIKDCTYIFQLTYYMYKLRAVGRKECPMYV